MNAPKPKLRRFQFSLRSLLVATAVICALLGVNTRVPRSLNEEFLDRFANKKVFRESGYGWPWVCITVTDVTDVTWPPDFEHWSYCKLFWFGLLGDIVIWFGVLAGVLWSVERICQAIGRF